MYRSRDHGRTWKALGRGLPRQPHYVGVLRDAMAVDSLQPAGVYLGTTMGEVLTARPTISRRAESAQGSRR